MNYMASGRCRRVVDITETEYLVRAVSTGPKNRCRTCLKRSILHKLIMNRSLQGKDFKEFALLLHTRSCQIKALSSIRCDHERNRCYTCSDVKLFLIDRDSIDLDYIYQTINEDQNRSHIRQVLQKYDHLINKGRI